MNDKSKSIEEIELKKIKEILKYYSHFLPESKKEDIASLKEIIKNKYGNYEIYLKEYYLAKQCNLIYPILEYLIKERYKIKISEITEAKLKEEVKMWKI